MKCSKISLQIAVRRVYPSFINFTNTFCISFGFWFLSPKWILEPWKDHCNYTAKLGHWVWGSDWREVEVGIDVWGSIFIGLGYCKADSGITKASQGRHGAPDTIKNLSWSNTTRHKLKRYGGTGRTLRGLWLGNLNSAIFAETEDHISMQPDSSQVLGRNKEMRVLRLKLHLLQDKYTSAGRQDVFALIVHFQSCIDSTMLPFLCIGESACQAPWKLRPGFTRIAFQL